MTDNKPTILSGDQTLVDHDLSNVYEHWNTFDNPVLTGNDVKFKKKETIDSLKKSVLKHRIRSLTGKDLKVIESEVGKAIETDNDLRRLAKLMILEACGKLPYLPKNVKTSLAGRKRAINDLDIGTDSPEPAKKRGRKSIAAIASFTPVEASPRRSRKSMLPSIPANTANENDASEGDEEIDLSELGPNPTPQMIDLAKRKRAQGKASPKKVKTPAAVPKAAAKKVKVDPPKFGYSGDECVVNLVATNNIVEKRHAYLDFNQIKKMVGGKFDGVHLTFIHTPVDWSPTDVFAVAMNIKLLNRKAGLDIFSIMVGCGIENVNMLMEALKRHTKHVQLVVFEREDQNEGAESNDYMLRETVSIFLLAYFFPDCEKEGSLPALRMVRPDMTTCFRAKDIEDLENTIIHTFSEKGDCVFGKK